MPKLSFQTHPSPSSFPVILHSPLHAHSDRLWHILISQCSCSGYIPCFTRSPSSWNNFWEQLGGCPAQKPPRTGACAGHACCQLSQLQEAELVGRPQGSAVRRPRAYLIIYLGFSQLSLPRWATLGQTALQPRPPSQAPAGARGRAAATPNRDDQTVGHSVPLVLCVRLSR